MLSSPLLQENGVSGVTTYLPTQVLPTIAMLSSGPMCVSLPTPGMLPSYLPESSNDCSPNSEQLLSSTSKNSK